MLAINLHAAFIANIETNKQDDTFAVKTGSLENGRALGCLLFSSV